MSSPCASAGPAQRCPCPCPACGPICLGTHGDWRRCWAHTSLIILLEKGIYIKAPEHVRHLRPWISRLKDWHIQSRGHQPFPLPTPSAASAPMLGAYGLTCSGVSIRVWWKKGAKWAEHDIHSEKASPTWVRTASAASCPKPQWPCLS